MVPANWNYRKFLDFIAKRKLLASDKLRGLEIIAQDIPYSSLIKCNCNYRKSVIRIVFLAYQTSPTQKGCLDLFFKAGTGTVEEHGRLGLGRDQVKVSSNLFNGKLLCKTQTKIFSNLNA